MIGSAELAFGSVVDLEDEEPLNAGYIPLRSSAKRNSDDIPHRECIADFGFWRVPPVGFGLRPT